MNESSRCYSLALSIVLSAPSLFAQNVTNTPASTVVTNQPTQLPEVIVQGREDSLIGVAASAAQGTVGAKELATRPLLRSGEVLETIPGVIITQHAGGGKANQYFVRGFNLDHGTDIAIDLDGMPLNLPSHAHGQGYADMNVVIPELIARVNYDKGPYYAANGDFSSSAAAHLEFAKTLPSDLAIVEAGMYGYERGVFAASPKVGEGHLLYGGEIYHEDGPWVHPDNYLKLNGMLTYSQGDDARGFSVTGHAYHGKWDSSDQIAGRAVSVGLVPFFGALDPSGGGSSQRYSVQAEWHRNDDQSATKLMAYTFYYDLNLFSDFTYFLTDTNRGDQFEQKDHRIVAGIDASHTLYNHLFDRDMENTFGIQVRNDWINNGIYQTENRNRINKTDSATGTLLPATTRQDGIIQTGVGMYYENKIQWAEKFRSIAGVRGNIYNFDVNDLNDFNSGDQVDGLASPKLSLVFGPWKKTEFYVNGGFDFHSNDARATTATQNPDKIIIGQQVRGLIQTKGAEVGARTTIIKNLQSTLSLWYLHSNSELLFEGDTGDTEASPQPSDRYGVEFANYYSATKWMTFDLDYANSWAYFTSPDSDGGKRVPEAIQQVVSAGVALHDLHGFYGALRLRYFGPRDLISTGAVQSKPTALLNLLVGYEINKHWSISAEVFNLLNRRDHDIDYYYQSRISPGASAVNDIHFHPVEPISARFAITARF